MKKEQKAIALNELNRINNLALNYLTRLNNEVEELQNNISLLNKKSDHLRAETFKAQDALKGGLIKAIKNKEYKSTKEYKKYTDLQEQWCEVESEIGRSVLAQNYYQLTLNKIIKNIAVSINNLVAKYCFSKRDLNDLFKMLEYKANNFCFYSQYDLEYGYIKVLLIRNEKMLLLNNHIYNKEVSVYVKHDMFVSYYDANYQKINDFNNSGDKDYSLSLEAITDDDFVNYKTLVDEIKRINSIGNEQIKELEDFRNNLETKMKGTDKLGLFELLNCHTTIKY